MRNILILEDEPTAYRRMCKMIKRFYPEVKIDVIDSIFEAVEYLNTKRVDLLIMDLQLSDGLSTELFKHVKISCPFLFVTACDELSLQWIKDCETDYLLKPVYENELHSYLRNLEIRQLCMQKVSLSDTEMHPVFPGRPAFKQKFYTYSQRGLLPLNPDDINAIKQESTGTVIITSKGEKVDARYTIEQLEQCIDTCNFKKFEPGFYARLYSLDKIRQKGNRVYISFYPGDRQPLEMELAGFLKLIRT